MSWLLSLFGGRGSAMRRIVTAMPPELRERFGSSDFYTVGQVKTVCRDLNIDESQWPIAFAAACDRATFVDVAKAGTDADYDRIRADLVERFKIGRDNFTVEDLAKAGPRSAAWSESSGGE